MKTNTLGGCYIFLVDSREAKMQFAGKGNDSPDQLDGKGDTEE